MAKATIVPATLAGIPSLVSLKIQTRIISVFPLFKI
jgi:hypothetical protein